MPRKLSKIEKIRQEIAHLCTSIGDRSFVIRKAEKQIEDYYEQIDKLRITLKELEVVNGSETPK